MKKILVIGSLNIDLVTRVPHLPTAGETIICIEFQRNFGGKGANQAVAAAKLGGNVSMIGKVGNDENGKEFIDQLKQVGVDTTGVIEEDGPTGMAFINVSSEGENNIVLVPGANRKISITDIDWFKTLIDASDFILLQLEIPIEVVEYIIKLAKSLGKEIILNPAPAQTLSKEGLASVDTLIPNETELQLLTGMPTNTENEILQAAMSLKSTGIKRVIVTVGEKGAFLVNDDGHHHLPAKDVKAVDTTAAGDAFIAGFIVGVAKGMTDLDAAKFATNVSAVVVTRNGAQASLPTIDEVDFS